MNAGLPGFSKLDPAGVTDAQLGAKLVVNVHEILLGDGNDWFFLDERMNLKMLGGGGGG